ncbi:MAG TPA: rod shape-determining protein [Clostridia bacterium]|nr:rod shape-determining protein [Clostridia bacterium]
MSLFGRDIGIDLGTANTLIYERNKGIILREPSVVAMESKTRKVVAVGNDARAMLGRTPQNIITVKPLKDGVIADYQGTLGMLKEFIRKAIGRAILSKPSMIICVPAGVTKVERKAVIEAGLEAGAKEIFDPEESLMAAVGSGLPVFEPTGNMIIDIGGGTTEVAVISMGNIVNSKTLRSAGDTFDELITQYIKKKYRVIIGARTAEDLKINIGNVMPFDEPKTMIIRGRNADQGLPVNLTVSSEEISEAMHPVIIEILESIRATLELTPPELAADVMANGIVLSGGGALISGLDRYLSEKTGNIPVRVADKPLECVALGAGKMLDKLDYFKGITKV